MQVPASPKGQMGAPMTEKPQNPQPELAQKWLQSPLGRSLLQKEQRLVEDAFDGIFGEECLQLGLWGEARSFLAFSRTQRTTLVANDAAGLPDNVRCVSGQLHRLPIASESVDAVFLPHTLEFSTRPHAILREVHRVLRSDGYLVVLGFKSGGLWGLRRLIPGAALPPGTDQLISDRRLKDWLNLLDLRIHGLTRYFFRWPLPSNGGPLSHAWERRGQRWWPELAACYMLTAQKRMLTLTPVKKVQWHARPKVVAGLAKPTSRVSRIRFDQNS
jgi:SAM-dependent methyltransferase